MNKVKVEIGDVKITIVSEDMTSYSLTDLAVRRARSLSELAYKLENNNNEVGRVPVQSIQKGEGNV